MVVSGLQSGQRKIYVTDLQLKDPSGAAGVQFVPRKNTKYSSLIVYANFKNSGQRCKSDGVAERIFGDKGMNAFLTSASSGQGGTFDLSKKPGVSSRH